MRQRDQVHFRFSRIPHHIFELGANQHYAIGEIVRQVSSVLDSFATHLGNNTVAFNHHHKCTFGGRNGTLGHDYRSAVPFL